MLLNDTHDIRTGAIVLCKKGNQWVCIGWTRTDEGRAAIFVRSVDGLFGTGKLNERIWMRHCHFTKTFEDYFTNAADFAI